MARGNQKKRKDAPSVAGSSTHSHAFSVADLEARPEDAPINTTVHRVSEDQRRVYVAEVPVLPPSPVKRLSDEWDAAPPEVSSVKKGPRVVLPGDASLDEWRRVKRDSYVTALIRRDGRGSVAVDVCPGCKGSDQGPPLFRCSDCFGDVLYCADCLVRGHRANPLHRVAKWNGRFFVKTSLAFLGLRIQLGHPLHEICPAPEAAHAEFVVLHSNGIHTVGVDFCGCEKGVQAGPPEIQLLRAGWFPATHERPQTCATLAVLEKFHQDTLQSKMTMYDFYKILENLTDATGIRPPDRNKEWIRMCREYRHTMMLKRGARAQAYDPTGADGTKQGELAILCPACPRPGVNLPEGWEKAPPEERFLYTFFLALDACFCLKRRLISSELRDPDLGPGWAYMVDTGPYREYLRGVTDQKEHPWLWDLA
ncbi:hypothetical protein B0H13DRAFT_2379559 [Mycena leptocephala]|nr:hypothetical protein B0H13DRAFT_2379559 [Mycena leptocephala]